MGFSHAGGDSPHSNFSDKLYGYARVAIPVLQVVNEFRKVFNGIYVMVGRRRNKAHAGCGETHLCDPRINF